MQDEIILPGIAKVKVRRGMNIRFLSVRMAPGRGVWVNVPYGVSGRKVEEFVFSQQEWIKTNLAKIKTYEKDTGVGLGMDSEVKTKFHVLKVLACDEPRPRYKIEGTEIRLYIPRDTDYAKIAPYVESFLVEVYRMESKRYLPGRVKELAERFGFRYRDLSFRNNISNWGSCSAEDNISLNVKLMKLPDEIIDYVILHEVCHTVEKNHSADFWSLMKKVCPDCMKLRGRLREYNTRV